MIRVAAVALIVAGLALVSTSTAAGHTVRPVAVAASTTGSDIKANTMTGRAYGLASSGLVAIPPTPDTGHIATTTPGTVAPPCVVSIPGLISANALCAKVVTSTPPRSVASASVADANIGVLGLPMITIGLVSSTSTSTCGFVSGSASVAGISVGGIPVSVVPDPTANMMVSVLGVTLIFNEQLPVAGASQGLEVNAVHIKALGLLDVVVASATSDVDDCVIPTPSPAPSLTTTSSSTTTTSTTATSSAAASTTTSSRSTTSSTSGGSGVAGAGTTTPATGAEVAFGLGLGLVIGGTALAFRSGRRRRREN